MQTTGKLFSVACRVAAFSLLMAGSAMLMQAQQTPSVAPVAKAPVFLAALAAPDYAASYFGSSSSSSSSSSDALAAEDSLGSATPAGLQPPPRRRYGQPSYSGGNTNPDGSAKWTGLGGFGLAMPIGITHKYETPSWAFQAGFGRDWSKTFGVIAEFDYDHFGLQGATIANESLLYTGATNGQGFDGNNHVWSFTINPTFTLATQGSLGAYAVVGAGFYHKVTNFTLPQQQCADYYCQFVITVNSTCGAICHYTSNAPGFSGGFGLTYKFSKFSNQRFYVEARYVFMDNSPRAGLTVADSTSPPYGTPSNPGGTYTGYNAYPANSNHTTYIPIKFGIRF